MLIVSRRGYTKYVQGDFYPHHCRSQLKHDLVEEDVVGKSQNLTTSRRSFETGAGVRWWRAGDVRWSHGRESSPDDHIIGDVRRLDEGTRKGALNQ